MMRGSLLVWISVAPPAAVTAGTTPPNSTGHSRSRHTLLSSCRPVPRTKAGAFTVATSSTAASDHLIPGGDRARDRVFNVIGCSRRMAPEVRTLPDVQDGRTDAIVGAASAEVGPTLSAHDGCSAVAVALHGAGVWNLCQEIRKWQ